MVFEKRKRPASGNVGLFCFFAGVRWVPCGHCGRDARGTLAPVADGEVEAGAIVVPVVRDPDGAGVRREFVAAGDPDPAAAVDNPVAGDPDIAGAGDTGAGFDDDGWRSGLDDGDLLLHWRSFGDDGGLGRRRRRCGLVDDRRGRRRCGLIDDGWRRRRSGLVYDDGWRRGGMIDDDDFALVVAIAVVFDVDSTAAAGDGKRNGDECEQGGEALTIHFVKPTEKKLHRIIDS